MNRRSQRRRANPECRAVFETWMGWEALSRAKLRALISAWSGMAGLSGECLVTTVKGGGSTGFLGVGRPFLRRSGSLAAS
jgi:hypothetical protein